MSEILPLVALLATTVLSAVAIWAMPAPNADPENDPEERDEKREPLLDAKRRRTPRLTPEMMDTFCWGDPIYADFVGFSGAK
ncbi:hypothetical protein B0H14DRAFT_2825749, partial [Mycena olivaceomarginata]